MSGWRSFPFGGRFPSPFGAAPSRPPQVTDDDYHYLGPEDIVDPPHRGDIPPTNYYPRHISREEAEDPRAPDILILKHRGTTYPLHFPAYTIGEGILKVGELRRFAAEKTGAGDPRRVKLLYKGKVLRDDAVACREEGLKQNSELMCIVSDAAFGGPSEDETSEESASEDDMRGPRVDVSGNIIHPKPRKSKRSKDKSKRRDTTNDRPRVDDRSYPPPPTNNSTPSNSSAPAPPPPKPAPSPAPPQQSNVPKGPMDKLDEIAGTFRDQFVPMAEDFLANVPRDEKTRTQEYMKISESILSMVIFKLDSVETEGDPDARNKRKALVKETQELLNRLDAVGKPKAEEVPTKKKKGGR